MSSRQWLGNIKGPKGDTGDPAGFDRVTAVVEGEPSPEPTITVETSGPDTAKNFDFTFHGIKGQPAGFGEVTAKIIGEVGTPSVTVETGGTNEEKTFDFTFENLKGQPAGFGDITAEVTGGVGIPSVELTEGGTNEAKDLHFNFKDLKGQPAGFERITARVTGGVGTPSVELTESGPNEAKILDFNFKDLKGQPAGFGDVRATINNESGKPEVTVKQTGTNEAQNLDFSFKNLKGDKGDRGGLTYKPLSEARFAADLMTAGQQDEDYDYIYYLDSNFHPQGTFDQWIDSHNIKSALFMLLAMHNPQGDDSDSSVLQVIWADNGKAEAHDRYTGNAELYVRSFPKSASSFSETIKRTQWLQIFPIHKITTEDIDEMIAGTYVSPFDEEDLDNIALVESREFNYFVQQLLQ